MRPLLQPVTPSIEDPLELLKACHDKVRRFSALVPRLREHLTRHGPDAQAQEAARSILRYFEVAAPLHHDDEEQDLFPALRALGQDPLNRHMDELQAEHGDLAGLWQQVRPWLQATADGQSLTCPDAAESFAQRYPAHAQREEDDVYPAAAGLDESSIRRISAAMVARRTHP